MVKKVLIIDDYYFIYEGLVQVLKIEFPKFAFRHAQNSTELLDMISNERFDLLIVDVEMSGVTHDVVANLKKTNPDVKILVFSALSDDRAIGYIRTDINGFLHKTSSRKELLESIVTIFDNRYYFTADLTRALIDHSTVKTPKMLLSDREHEIFLLLAQGCGNLEICNRLNLKSGTVSTYKRRILAKLQIENIAQLVKMEIASKDHV